LLELDWHEPSRSGDHVAIVDSATNAAIANREIRLELYDVGLDRSSEEEFHPGQIAGYQGVLVVRLLIQASFEDGATHASWVPPGVNDRQDVLTRIRDAWASMTDHYRLVGGSAAMGFQRIYLFFMAGFTGAASADTNYRVHFLRANTPAGDASISRNAGTGTHDAHRDFSADASRRYFLGLPEAVPAGTTDQAQETDRLSSTIEPWINAELATVAATQFNLVRF
jgi:hypothetical protein